MTMIGSSGCAKLQAAVSGLHFRISKVLGEMHRRKKVVKNSRDRSFITWSVVHALFCDPGTRWL